MSISSKVVIGASGVSLFSWLTNKLYGNLTDSVYDRRAHIYEPAGIVSIIIPAFNEEAYIEQALKSILSQNIIHKYPDYFECIVVDNESTDTTTEIAKQYCQVISAPRGMLNARHAGILEASGDIMVSCDADSYYPPNWLNLILRHFHKPKVVAVYGPHLLQGNLLYKIGMVWYMNLIHYAFSGSGCSYLKDAYLTVGGFNLSIDQFNREKMQIESEMVLPAKLHTIGEIVFEIKACNFASARHLELKDIRPKSRYVQEVRRGERF